jgi:Na+-transporting methylmalonyl-CoA/oxaloacetate decarboxylase gamma subunit
MDVTWGEAFRIGGIGFGFVFMILIILAVAVFLVGLVIRRIGRGRDEANREKKGD